MQKIGRQAKRNITQVLVPCWQGGNDQERDYNGDGLKKTSNNYMNL